MGGLLVVPDEALLTYELLEGDCHRLRGVEYSHPHLGLSDGSRGLPFKRAHAGSRRLLQPLPKASASAPG